MIAAKRRMPNPLTPERASVDDDAVDIRYSSIISTNCTMILVCVLSGLVLVMPFCLIWATLIV
ncbi:hypothetical protein AIQ71_11810 [Salmonella enterica]|uniref:Uncharacterized protein n=6 Tax=Salmonella enterica TaxID=28901 RepID=A0A3Z4JPZ6_SALER|nr:hypothetical protein LFZ50_16075 [Salmonella enterica subsp. arizonae serovar 53:-:- str. SA20100345]EAA5368103.1 hypothetical protein [Salmonella enterica subsp. arizonae]EAA7632960.1 hypothetical protein [Salmonella enterica]EAO6000672.1 hypothetical protein [Salmonella enterica subsp. arizonae serovar 62:z36:-]EAT8892009.1 hypothetical protein [Salmonella enterica subsp. arizonae serovar 53:z4,z23,z32:-]EAT8923940.1 hypothetical protein [Salmonella enterica subsp. arizonae serovar 63:z4,